MAEPSALSKDEIKAFLTTFPGYGDAGAAAAALDGAPSDGTWIKLGRTKIPVDVRTLAINKDVIAPFTYLQDSMTSLTQLSGLRIAHAPVTTIPGMLGSITTLTDLSCEDLLELEDVEELFWPAACRRLVTLTFSGCPKLPALPDAVHNLVKATSLNFSMCRLRAVPESIASLPRLEHLHLHHNHITSLPRYWSLVNLLTIDLSNNELSTLPVEICNCRQLTSFLAPHNKIVRVPDDFGRLNQLTTLDLSFNAIVSLPESIGFLRVMRTFAASHNQLVLLPDTVSRWTALQELDLEGNHIEEIPKSLRRLTRLTTMSLRGNPLFNHRTDSYGRDILELQLKRILEERRLEKEMAAEDAERERTELEAAQGEAGAGGASAFEDESSVMPAATPADVSVWEFSSST